MKANKAFVTVIDGRFFYGFNKRGHMMTASGLPGAKLFSEAKDAIAIEQLARMKGRDARVEPLKLGGVA